jgi:hypothetical protein
MANANAELKKALKKNGWALFREGTKHYVYAKNGQTLLIPYGSHIYSRTYKQILLKIKGQPGRSRSTLS